MQQHACGEDGQVAPKRHSGMKGSTFQGGKTKQNNTEKPSTKHAAEVEEFSVYLGTLNSSRLVGMKWWFCTEGVRLGQSWML